MSEPSKEALKALDLSDRLVQTRWVAGRFKYGDKTLRDKRACIIDAVYKPAFDRIEDIADRDGRDYSNLKSELATLQAAKAAVRAAEEEAESVHAAWLNAVLTLAPHPYLVTVDAGETTEETIGHIVGQIRDQLAET